MNRINRLVPRRVAMAATVTAMVLAAAVSPTMAQSASGSAKPDAAQAAPVPAATAQAAKPAAKPAAATSVAAKATTSKATDSKPAAAKATAEAGAATTAKAKVPSKPKAAASATATTKTCKYKMSTGKVQTWTCNKDQPCCASEQFNLYTCGSQLLQCI